LSKKAIAQSAATKSKLTQIDLQPPFLFKGALHFPWEKEISGVFSLLPRQIQLTLNLIKKGTLTEFSPVLKI
jgi:hypothetical protein